jgi:ribosomal protein S18 acetylase RimI-like enzyme
VEFVFRLAEETDAAAVRTILNTAYTDTWTAHGLHVTAATQGDGTTRDQIEVGDVYVLVHTGKIAGTVRVQRKQLRDEVVAYVTHLARRPESAGLHLGSRLMAEAEKVARDFGASRVTLDTAAELADLISFYRGLGYESFGRFMHSRTYFWSTWLEKKLVGRDEPAPQGETEATGDRG